MLAEEYDSDIIVICFKTGITVNNNFQLQCVMTCDIRVFSDWLSGHFDT